MTYRLEDFFEVDDVMLEIIDDAPFYELCQTIHRIATKNNYKLTESITSIATRIQLEAIEMLKERNAEK